jgi:hypothetical protein
VSYACKGNEVLAIECKQVKKSLSFKTKTGDENDIIKTVQKLLNNTASSRTAAKKKKFVKWTNFH